MRIAFVSFEYPPAVVGGAGVYADRLTDGLSKLGHDVVVFTPGVSGIATRARPSIGLEVRRTRPSPIRGYPALPFWWRLPAEVAAANREAEFDAIHFNGLSYWFAGRRRLISAPHILTVHHVVKGIAALNRPALRDRLAKPGGENGLVAALLERRSIRNADRICAVSQFTKQRLLDSYRVDPEKVTVVYNGVETLPVTDLQERFNGMRPSLGLPKGPTVLWIGRLDEPRKRLELMIKAFSEVSRSADATLLIIGRGSSGKAVKQARSLGIANRVRWLGAVSRPVLDACYAGCTVYVSTSSVEGFGLTVLEAMIAGKPVVVTRVGGIPELVEHGRNGLLVDPENPSQLADGILYYLQNPVAAASIGYANRQMATERQGWVSACRAVEELYKREAG